MALEKSMLAPDFQAPIEGGKELSLKDYRGKWVILYFYPKDNTSGCTTEACDFRDNMERITQEGAEVIGVSPDSVKSHDNFIAKHGLNFHLVSDTEKEICNMYGVIGEKNMFGKKVMGLIRTTFIINPEGEISYVFNNVRAKGHVDKVIEKLNELKAQ
jgi:thioredoxin-dependent peroxiredoxin